MGAGGGAMVAIMAAAHAQRLQQVLDAFRIAGATSPDRAKPVDALGLSGVDSEVDEHVRTGVLVAGARPGTLYLDEAAYVTRRDRGTPRGALIAIAISLILLTIILAIVISSKVAR